MANTIARQVLLNGSRLYVVKFTIIGDGSGEESNTIVNASTGDMGTTPSLYKVYADLSGFTARLLWDATTKVFAQQVPDGFSMDRDYTSIGGLKNNAGTGVTGDILITTTGLGAGDSGSITLVLKKQ